MQDRLVKPLQRIDNQLVEISFEEAFAQIAARIRGVSAPENLFVAGGGAPNEQLYLIQRLARAGVRSNALTSFEYFARGNNFSADKNDIVPFAELPLSSRLFFIGFPENCQHPEWLKVREIQQKFSIAESSLPLIPPIAQKNMEKESALSAKSAGEYEKNLRENTPITDYAAFFRAANYYLIKNDLAKGIFIHGIGKNYEPYKQNLLSDDFSNLLKINELSEADLVQFVQVVMAESAPAFIYWEEQMSEAAVQELTNFLMLLELQAKTGSGALGIKRSANAQGLFDMGCFANRCVGGEKWTTENRAEMDALYNNVETRAVDVEKAFFNGTFKNAFIFGDDFSGNPRAHDIEAQLRQVDFVVVQSATLTPAARLADLILPASLPEELGGTYTDSTRMARTLAPTAPSAVALTSIEQLQAIGAQLGLPRFANPSDIFLEYIAFFHAGCRSAKRHFFCA